MKRKRSVTILIAALVLLVISIVAVLITHKTSYQASVATGVELSEVKATISSIEKGDAAGNLDLLKSTQSALSDRKLTEERPYSFALIGLFFSILLLFKGIYNAVIGVAARRKADVKTIALAGLMAALCYIGFAFLKIDIPVGPDKTAFHFGNVFCVLAALLLGGFWGGLAGAVGMTIGDLTTAYVTSAPKTFLLKLLIGLIVGFVAHTLCKLSHDHKAGYVSKVTVISAICGMGFNIVADPLVGYYYKMYLLGVPQELSSALTKMRTLTTFVNAIVAIIAASIFYLALRPALKKTGLFVTVPSRKDLKEAAAEEAAKAEDVKAEEAKSEE